MATSHPRGVQIPSGPFRADQIREGEFYELSDGHKVECQPTGGRGSGPNLQGAAAVASDPMVTEAGVDPGYSPDPGTLRAPDIGVGNVPDKPGWIEGAPQLAIEYADVGQEEAALQRKIQDLMKAGTKYLWVVRLVGPRRVEVYEAGKAMALVWPRQVLKAPGVLKNDLPVEALYDRSAAQAHTLRNLLERYGYRSLDEVREEGRDEGRESTLREVIVKTAPALSVKLPNNAQELLSNMGAEELDQVWQHLIERHEWPL